MHTLMGSRTGPLLVQEGIERYRPLGAYGRAVHESHLQIRNVLGARLGPRFADYFSEPGIDARDRSARWTATVSGPVHRWRDLPADEQVRRALDMEELRAGFLALIGSMRTAGAAPGEEPGGSPQAFASLLEQALTVPDGDHLYFVGDQPVVTFWGFRRQDGHGIDALTLRPPAPATAAAPGTVAASSAAGRPRRSAAVVVADTFFAAFAVAAAPGPLAMLVAAAVLRLALPAGHRSGDRAGACRTECRGAPGPGGLGTGPDGGSARGVTLVPGQPGQAAPTQELGSASTLPPSSATPAQTQPQGPQVGTQPPPPAGAQTPPPGRPLDIPSDAAGRNDLSFLEGQWRSGQGLVDQIDGQPLEQIYRFDRHGKGEVVIRRADGMECRAPAEASFDGPRLQVRELDDPRCPDGQSYGRVTTRCDRDAAGRTVCRSSNAEGSTYVVPIEQQP